MTECFTKLSERASDLSEKSKMCPYYQDMMACYPTCYCNNAAVKSTLDTAKKSSEDAMKAMGITCSLTCGNGKAPSSGTKPAPEAPKEIAYAYDKDFDPASGNKIYFFLYFFLVNRHLILFSN